MFKNSILISLFAVFVCSAAVVDSVFVGKVISVSDGDTITVLVEASEIQSPQLRKEITQLREKVTPQLLKKVTVRLYGVDCPEKTQAFGQKAMKFTSDLVLGKRIKVVARGYDDNGIVIGTVFLDDEHSLNNELLQAGLAWWNEKDAKDDFELEKLQEEARKEGSGLWAHSKPLGKTLKGPPAETSTRGEHRREQSIGGH
jgi:endonuclease YncB( thermonuclease family)